MSRLKAIRLKNNIIIADIKNTKMKFMPNFLKIIVSFVMLAMFLPVHVHAQSQSSQTNSLAYLEQTFPKLTNLYREELKKYPAHYIFGYLISLFRRIMVLKQAQKKREIRTRYLSHNPGLRTCLHVKISNFEAHAGLLAKVPMC